MAKQGLKMTGIPHMKNFILFFCIINFGCSDKLSLIQQSDRYILSETPVRETIEERYCKTIVNSNDSIRRITNYTYNQEGKLTKRSVMINDEEIETDIFQYDNGNLIEKCLGIYEHFSPDDSYITCAFHEYCYYNDDGQKIKCERYDSIIMDSLAVEFYYYNNFGNLSEVKTKTQDTSYISSKYFYSQDEFTRTKQINYNELGVLLDTKLYKYNRNFLLKEKRHLDQDNRLTTQNNYKYDKRGNLTKCIISNERGRAVQKNIYSYNDADKLILRTIRTTGKDKRVVKSEYFYDAFGKLIKEVEYVEK